MVIENNSSIDESVIGGKMENPTKFCSACGNGLVETAVVCPSCGSPVVVLKVQASKKKSVAVVLAVFLGYWSWLYTPKKNLAKFFIALVLSVIAGIVIGVNQAALSSWADGWTYCLLTNIQTGSDYDCDSIYPSNDSWGSFIQLGWVSVVVIYLWSLIDNIRHSSEYFEKYPDVIK